MQEKKPIILGTFVNKKKILSFFEKLKNDFAMNLSRLFVFSIDSNQSEYLATFKTTDKDMFSGKLEGLTILHSKNGCLFSINALNEYARQNGLIGEDESANDVEIDWNPLSGILVMMRRGKLTMSRIEKIPNNCVLLLD